MFDELAHSGAFARKRRAAVLRWLSQSIAPFCAKAIGANAQKNGLAGSDSRRGGRLAL